MILLDTGPLLAILDRSDSQHGLCLATLSQFSDDVLTTTWPCFTEALYLLGRQGGFNLQRAAWDLWLQGSIDLHSLSDDKTIDAAQLMEQYQDLPMDLGDASLMATANYLGIRRIFTLDSDFHIYRLKDGTPLEVIP